MKYEIISLICILLLFHQTNSVSAQQQNASVAAAANVVDLSCSNFDNSCAWHNWQKHPASPIMWFRSTANITKDQMVMTTNTDTTPNGSYAIAASISTNQSMHAILVSDPVPCQAANGSLAFNYWTSPFVILKVCQLFEGTHFNRSTSANCTKTPFSQGPGPANITIPPSRKPFELLIEASNFVFSNGPLTGGFAIVDNIVYNGDFCIVKPNVTAGNATAGNSTVPVGNSTASGVNSTTGNSTISGGNSTISGGNSTASANRGNSTVSGNSTMASNSSSSATGGNTNLISTVASGSNNGSQVGTAPSSSASSGGSGTNGTAQNSG